MKTVIVESPAKCRTINKYLGKDYKVMASFGHVRDLPSKDGSVRPDEDFAMDYVVPSESKKHIAEIAKAVKESEVLYLATDPDREGEAISWHVLEALKGKKALHKGLEVRRIAFSEITQKAVSQAIANPRDIDMNLVNSQQARRALDYLVGFTLSPVLWRKLPGAKSAGRVQSVALRLICERDAEIESFVAREYWDIAADLLSSTNADISVRARLTHYGGEKLDKFSIADESRAFEIKGSLSGKVVTVSSVTPKQMRRNPYPPFTTSTLQMDASRKLRFSAKKTMTIAQRLYEGFNLGGETTGLITYMRTDGVTIAAEAIEDIRRRIAGSYGDKYLPAKPRIYKTKAKNAQEAHEAIRPTSMSRTPEEVRSFLSDDEFRLYELIYKRTLASQMEAAVYDKVAVEFEEPATRSVFRANGSVLKFDGFLKLYREAADEGDKKGGTAGDDDDDTNRILPPLEVGQSLDIAEIFPEQHFTEPPPRYSEASLVKRLEELGIGRPSTYATILSVLQERGYVRLENRRFVAEMRGRLVSAFLEKFFEKYVEYDFTAKLENELDEISAGKVDWKKVLRDFWVDFVSRTREVMEIPIQEVIDTLDRELAAVIFGTPAGASSSSDSGAVDYEELRRCPKCGTGRMGLKLGRFGAFLGCSNHPECKYTRQLDGVVAAADGSGGDDKTDGDVSSVVELELPKLLGTHPETGEDILLKKGPYGVYVQLGEGKKPKRSSLPKGMSAADVTLDDAVSLLSLPREVGVHPDTGKVIKVNNGRFGPYIHYDGAFISLGKNDDLLTIGLDRALELIAENSAKKGVEPLRVIGKHPDDGEEVAIYSGRYGAYVKHGGVNASLDKEEDIATVTMDRALELLAARSKSSKGKGRGRRRRSQKG